MGWNGRGTATERVRPVLELARDRRVEAAARQPLLGQHQREHRRQRHHRIAAGIEGGYVLLGMSIRKLSIEDGAMLITIIHAFGDERGVKWSRTSLGRDVPDEVCA